MVHTLIGEIGQVLRPPQYRYMGLCPIVKLRQINTDTIWICQLCVGRAYEYKIWSVVIIFAHRQYFRGLISLFLSEKSTLYPVVDAITGLTNSGLPGT